jgi:MscS family membrane protein
MRRSQKSFHHSANLGRVTAALATCALAAVAAAQDESDLLENVRRQMWPSWALRLDPWFQSFFLGLGLWQWIALGALLVLSLFVGYVVRQILTVALRARYGSDATQFSQSSKRGTRRAVAIIVAAGIWNLALPSLALPGETRILIEHIIQLVAAVVVIWLAISLWNAFCDVLLHRSEPVDKRTERLLIPVTRKFVTAVIVIGGAFAVLALIGVNVIGFIYSLGIGGLAVALAAKDSVENVFGSLTILFDMPFALGDWVKIDKVEGVVEQINLRSTKIRTFEDSMITLPNSNLIKASVENFGARRFRRQKFSLRFSHDSEPDAVESFCDDLRVHIKALDGVVGEKTIVELNEVTEQWIGVLVMCYLDAAAPVDELRLRSKLMAEALRLARTRKLKFASATPVPGSDGAGSPEQADSELPKVE